LLPAGAIGAGSDVFFLLDQRALHAAREIRANRSAYRVAYSRYPVVPI